MNASHPHTSQQRRRDVVVAATCGVVVAGMVGMAFAAVPFYNWFCRTTGFGGTPQVAAAAPGKVLDRRILIRFDANVSAGMPWRFEPEQPSVEVRIGDVITVNYRATNLSAQPTIGQASYNVSPPTVGAYFTKINCFCFTEQRLAPGETRDMPVVFFVDPEIVKDAEQDGLASITLSYTMYPVRPAEPPRVERGGAAAPGRS